MIFTTLVRCRGWKSANQAAAGGSPTNGAARMSKNFKYSAGVANGKTGRLTVRKSWQRLLVPGMAGVPSTSNSLMAIPRASTLPSGAIVSEELEKRTIA
jgi:hypothetical protein